MPKKTISKKNVTKRVVKRVVSKTRKTTQKPSSKVKNYERAYALCVEKAISACAKRKAMLNKPSRKPKNTKSAAKQKMDKVTKTDKSGYTEFIKKHMKDKDLVKLPVTERMKKIGEMWRKSK